MSNIESESQEKVTTIAFTPGEPAGVGPDLALSLVAQPRNESIIVFADPTVIASRAKELRQKITIIQLDDIKSASIRPIDCMQVMPIPCPNPSCQGRPDPVNSLYVLECLNQAVDGCANGQLDAMVTGPISKETINAAGIPFTGHTDYIAKRLNIDLPIMMLTSGDLKVILLTTHIPLSKVPQQINQKLLTQVVKIIHKELISKFHLPNPRIQICGLNPHAGEGGHLGHEEETIIKPAIQRLKSIGMRVEGPVSADSAFTRKARNEYDAIVAMYHDQGLVALKTIGFGSSVNVTLGLPIIRSSVDHGTALALAGTGKVDNGSVEAALKLAITLSGNKKP